MSQYDYTSTLGFVAHLLVCFALATTAVGGVWGIMEIVRAGLDLLGTCCW